MPDDMSVHQSPQAISVEPQAALARPFTVASDVVAAAAGTGLRPSPTTYFDPAAGIVVLEFIDAQGNVSSSIPTQRQLHTLQEAGRAGKGPVDTAASVSPASPQTIGGSDAQPKQGLGGAASASDHGRLDQSAD